MHPEEIYVVSGGASANSLFLEDKHCHNLFFDYLSRFVCPMVTILHYKVNSSGWTLLIEVKSKEEINKAYLDQRNKSKTANRDKDLVEVKRILSEHFRMFLSNFAKECNRYLNRNGVLVLKKFDKQRITDEQEYQKQFDLIYDLQSCRYKQVLKKYQPDKSLYDKEGLLRDKEGVAHVLCSSVGVYKKMVKIESLPISLALARPYSHVLRKVLKKGRNIKNPKYPPSQNE